MYIYNTVLVKITPSQYKSHQGREKMAVEIFTNYQVTGQPKKKTREGKFKVPPGRVSPGLYCRGKFQRQVLLFFTFRLCTKKLDLLPEKTIHNLISYTGLYYYKLFFLVRTMQ